MPRYLIRGQLEMALRNRRPVEQWLGARDEKGRRVLRWLGIEPRETGEYAVRVREVYDCGNEHFFDIYEFEPLDLDEPEGLVTTFAEWGAALIHAASLGAKREQFVPHGRIQDVYREFAFGVKN